MTADDMVRLRSFSRSLPMALLSAREAVMNRFRPILRAHGVTEQQWRVLRALDGVDGLDAGELARRCCLLTPSLTRIVKNLEVAGLAISQRDASDRRKVRIAITTAGRTLIAQVAPLSEAQYSGIADSFGQDNLDELYAALDRLMDSLKPTNR